MTNNEQSSEFEKKIENNNEIIQENKENDDEDVKSNPIKDNFKSENKVYTITKSMNRFDYKKLNIIREEIDLKIETIDKKEKSTIRTDKKKVKIKTVIRKHTQKCEPKEDNLDLIIKENKENEIDFEGISEEGSFVMIKENGKFLIDDKEKKINDKTKSIKLSKENVKRRKRYRNK